VLHIELASIGIASMLPYIVPFVFANVGGMLADGIIALEGRYGWASAKTARKLCQGIDFVGGSCSLSLLISLQNSSDAPSAVLAIGLLSFTLACASFGTAGYW